MSCEWKKGEETYSGFIWNPMSLLCGSGKKGRTHKEETAKTICDFKWEVIWTNEKGLYLIEIGWEREKKR